MSLKPICIAIALTLTLTACGSTGSSSNSIKTVSIETLKNSVDAELREEFGSDGFTKTDSYQINVAGKTYTSGSIDLNNLGNGLQRLDVIETASAKVQGQDYSATRNSKLHLYQQPYSVVAGVQVINGSISDANGNVVIRDIGGSDLDINFVKGEATKTLPSAGTYNYAGKAFSQESSGQFNYAVNFDTRKGSGSITGIEEAGKITLNEGTISNLSHTNPDNTTISGFGIQSTATSANLGNGEYKLGFFGPNAEEVAGTVSNAFGDVGFGGTKQ